MNCQCNCKCSEKFYTKMKVYELLEDANKQIDSIKSETSRFSLFNGDGHVLERYKSNIVYSAERSYRKLKLIHDKYAKDLGFSDNAEE